MIDRSLIDSLKSSFSAEIIDPETKNKVRVGLLDRFGGHSEARIVDLLSAPPPPLESAPVSHFLFPQNPDEAIKKSRANGTRKMVEKHKRSDSAHGSSRVGPCPQCGHGLSVSRGRNANNLQIRRCDGCGKKWLRDVTA